MKALKSRRRYDIKQSEIAWEERQRQEEAKISTMSEEDRHKYLENKKKKQREAIQLLSLMSSISGPYSR